MPYMVQQDGNKQHFTINSATPSNPANITLESIYHTFNFVFSVRPEVNLVGSIVCEHPRATKLTQRLMEWCESIIAETNTVPPEVTDDCGPRQHTCLNDGEQCLSGAISNRCKTGVRDSCLTPTKTHTVMHNWLELHFCLLRHLSHISLTMQTPPQPPNHD